MVTCIIFTNGLNRVVSRSAVSSLAAPPVTVWHQLPSVLYSTTNNIVISCRFNNNKVAPHNDLAAATHSGWVSETTPFPIGVGRKGRDSEVTNCLISSSALPYAAPEGMRQSYLKPILDHQFSTTYVSFWPYRTFREICISKMTIKRNLFLQKSIKYVHIKFHFTFF